MHRFPDLPPLLTAEDESRLARQIEAGVLATEALRHGLAPEGATVAELRMLQADGEAAWQRFLLSNLRLVWAVIRPTLGRCQVEADELLQEGFVALAHALQRYDHTRGRFSTYALPMVRQHVQTVTSSRAGMLGIPGRRAVTLRRARALVDHLGQELGRQAEVAEVAEALGSSVEWTRQLLGHRPPVSLEAVSAADWVVEPEPQDVAAWLDAARIAADLDLLPPHERGVVRLRFGFDDGRCRSYREIAELLGGSASAVRRSCERALGLLRRRHAEDPAMPVAS